MTVFLSYAHQDDDQIAALRQAFEDMGYSVWLDTSLHGGQVWWDEILHQVRECEVFVLALSRHSLASEACLAECEYSAAVNRPFLPVRIGEVDLAATPERLRNTQLIDFQKDHAPSVLALARAMNSVPDSVPLPEVLPPPPPTPQSYRDRYAALLGSEPLTMNDQMSYFIRLTVDIDTADSEEALELLQALHRREDLSWKVRQRIDRFLEDRHEADQDTNSTSDEHRELATEDRDGVDQPEADTPARPRRSRRPRWVLWWVLAGAMTVLVIGGAILLLGHDDQQPVQQPANATCAADTCSDTPIRFFIDRPGGSGQAVSVTLTDPYGFVVPGVDVPTDRVDGAGLEWLWSATYEDPIGVYIVNLSGGGTDSIDHTFTIEPVPGPFGVVQRAAEAIATQDWQEAAAIDDRIANELAENGPVNLEADYPVTDDKHWVPYDASGQSNAASTTIIGAFVSYRDSTETTTASCELWTVKSDGLTMRSDALPLVGEQQRVSVTGELAPSDFSEFIADNCVEAAGGS
jgi:hypothetical protein